MLATAGILLWAAPSQAWENLFFCLLLWGSWAVGLLTRRSRQRAEQLGRLAARLDAEREIAESTAVAEERARIARDVHDSVAHSVSVMVLQLGALRTTVEPGSRVAEVLQGVERLGRQSVDELRGLVGVLRETPVGPPPRGAVAGPGVGADRRGARRRPAGGAARCTASRGELPQALDVSAYRVLQEALSNVLRHAGRVPTTVSVRRDAAALTVQVEDDGAGHPRARGRRGRARPARHPRAGGHVRRRGRGRPAAARAASGSPRRFPLQDAR